MNWKCALALGLLAAVDATAAAAPAAPAPSQPPHPDLVGVLRDLDAWLPGEWDSYPQVALERALGALPEGEHEHWYRIITRIDAPQLGSHVYYGELFTGGRGGELIRGQQILYVATIDPASYSVNIKGGGLAEPEKFLGLGQRTELWGKVRMREGAGPCPFRWRRNGNQLSGKLGTDGKCRTKSQRTGKDMMFDAEWVLTPDELWVFDNNYLLGPGPDEKQLFIGREDRTHMRLYRMTDFSCTAQGGSGPAEKFTIHDRGGAHRLRDGAEVRLLRGPLATASKQVEPGLELSVTPAAGEGARAVGDVEARAITLTAGGRTVACTAPAAPAKMEKAASPARAAVSAPAVPATTVASAAPTVPSAASLASATPRALPACDVGRGQQVYMICAACHGLSADAPQTAGPRLIGVIGRRAGSLAGYPSYSKAMREAGFTWDRNRLDHYLEEPAKALPGNGMMFIGLKSAQDRSDVICFLEQQVPK
jgi:cytochrome c